MKVIANEAEQVCQALQTEDGVAKIDVAIIIAIISAVIQLFMQCNRSQASALDIMKNPGIFHRWTLRGVVHDKLVGETRSYAKEVQSAVLKHGRGLTLNKVKGMFSEVKAT